MEPLPVGEIPQGYAQLSHDRGDYIVASASCDVGQDGYPYALLARVVPATESSLKAKDKELRTKLEVLRNGLVPSQFLLSPCDFINPSFPLSIAQHKVHVLLPVAYLAKCCTGKRLRLRHPLREKFGNWVGTCFSRVGPEDPSQIPQGVKIFPGHVLAANSETTI